MIVCWLGNYGMAAAWLDKKSWWWWWRRWWRMDEKIIGCNVKIINAHERFWWAFLLDELYFSPVFISLSYFRSVLRPDDFAVIETLAQFFYYCCCLYIYHHHSLLSCLRYNWYRWSSGVTTCNPMDNKKQASRQWQHHDGSKNSLNWQWSWWCWSSDEKPDEGGRVQKNEKKIVLIQGVGNATGKLWVNEIKQHKIENCETFSVLSTMMQKKWKKNRNPHIVYTFIIISRW